MGLGKKILLRSLVVIAWVVIGFIGLNLLFFAMFLALAVGFWVFTSGHQSSFPLEAIAYLSGFGFVFTFLCYFQIRFQRWVNVQLPAPNDLGDVFD